MLGVEPWSGCHNFCFILQIFDAPPIHLFSPPPAPAPPRPAPPRPDLFLLLSFLGSFYFYAATRSLCQKYFYMLLSSSLLLQRAQAIATECGIYDPEYGVAMEGPEFRKMTPAQLDEILPRLQASFVCQPSPLGPPSSLLCSCTCAWIGSGLCMIHGHLIYFCVVLLWLYCGTTLVDNIPHRRRDSCKRGGTPLRKYLDEVFSAPLFSGRAHHSIEIGLTGREAEGWVRARVRARATVVLTVSYALSAAAQCVSTPFSGKNGKQPSHFCLLCVPATTCLEENRV